jgi:hypothetical protein
MDDAPELHHILIPMSWGGFVGLILGSILAFGAEVNKPVIVVAWIVGGCFVGWLISRWLLSKREDYVYYQSGASALPEGIKQTDVNDGTVVLSLVLIDGDSQRVSKEIRGLTREEWHMLGIGVCKSRNYTTRILQDIFGAGRGLTIYNLITNILKDNRVRILMDKNNGVVITEGRGWSFFEHLRKEEYEILNILDALLPSPEA